MLGFKFRSERASFSADRAKASVDGASLRELLPALRAKVRAYQADYLSSSKDI